MSEPEKEVRVYTQNRELSWLKFNARVLEEAADPSVPLMERLKFVSIFTSNLDEFFMIRVGSLFDLSAVNAKHKDEKSGFTADEQLLQIYEAVRLLYARKTSVYREIKRGLRMHGLNSLDFKSLDANEVEFVKEYYKMNIEPILSPQIVDTHHPFPHISSKDIYIMALLKKKDNHVLGLLPVPSALPEVVYLPGDDIRYIRTESIILEFANQTFRPYDIKEKNCICITRNADITRDDFDFESVGDFRLQMKKLLHKRTRLSVVRLEANYPLSGKFQELLCDRFKIKKHQIYVCATALKMKYVFDLFSKLSAVQTKQLVYKPLVCAPCEEVDCSQSVIKQIKQRDILQHYPYQSMDVFLKMIKEASARQDVISIKITIYRLAKKAKLVDYLCAAAENGKEVTVLMELRARFDEQNNIDWSERLEDSGCKVIYGFDEFKTHSKVCLITMREKNGISYVTQVGTGNYNETTAKLYTDLSLITANQAIGLDAAEFFKNMSIGNIGGQYKRLLVAPTGFKKMLLRLIRIEIKKGNLGLIRMKMNSLTDIDIIDSLAEASKAGVAIQLIIRGISCLVPGIPGETENITITSVVGRFLEHSRIYSFGTGEDQKLFIASADLMTRNTQRRIEVACPVESEQIKYQINKILEITLRDNIKARQLQSDGSYVHTSEIDEPMDCQKYFIKYYKNIKRPTVKSNSKNSVIKRIINKLKKR